jgi:transposase
VVFSFEHTGHYHEPIVALLRERNCTVLPLNSVTTKKERESDLDRSKTDELDVNYIAAAVSAGKVVTDRPMRPEEEELRFLSRQRRSIVQRRANAFVELHVLIDRYWPAFQGIPEVVDGKARVERIFAKTWPDRALRFLQLVSTPAEALALGEAGLRELSRRERLALGTRRIGLVLRAAELAPKVSEPLLKQYVERLRSILASIAELNTRIEPLEDRCQELLAGSRGVLLLTMPQVGAVTAAEYMAEIGFLVPSLHSAAAVIKLAGTNPVPDQSGSRRWMRKISKQGVAHYRTLTYQLGYNLFNGKGNPYFKAFGRRLVRLKPKQIRIAVGNKAHRVIFAMLKNGEVFAPKTWTGPPLTMNPLPKLKSCYQERARAQLLSLGVTGY